MIVSLPCFTVRCDAPDCTADALEHSDYVGFGDVGYVFDQAIEGDWYVVKDTHLCPKHAPRCACEECPHHPGKVCPVQLRDDEFGNRCEDCSEEEP